MAGDGIAPLAEVSRWLGFSCGVSLTLLNPWRCTPGHRPRSPARRPAPAIGSPHSRGGACHGSGVETSQRAHCVRGGKDQAGLLRSPCRLCHSGPRSDVPRLPLPWHAPPLPAARSASWCSTPVIIELPQQHGADSSTPRPISVSTDRSVVLC